MRNYEYKRLKTPRINPEYQHIIQYHMMSDKAILVMGQQNHTTKLGLSASVGSRFSAYRVNKFGISRALSR
ncbi:MAG: hypothetical protein LBG64_02850 [Pseudomonadales bacterium]|jgi:hypothetical protein|nr:hypothetical protein [Pseudomonadales bacterium]